MSQFELLGGEDPREGAENDKAKSQIVHGKDVVKSFNTGLTVDSLKSRIRAEHELPWLSSNGSLWQRFRSIFADIGNAIRGVFTNPFNSYASSEIRGIASAVQEPLGDIRDSVTQAGERMRQLDEKVQQTQQQQTQITETMGSIVRDNTKNAEAITEARTAAEKALEGLSTRLDIDAELMQTGADGRPEWAKGFTRVAHPDWGVAYEARTKMVELSPHHPINGKLVEVSDKIDYRIRIEYDCHDAGEDPARQLNIFGLMWLTDTGHAAIASAAPITRFPGDNGHRFVAGFVVVPGLVIGKHVTEVAVRFKRGVKKVGLYAVGLDLNFSDGGQTPFVQIKQITCNPMVPTQYDVDKAQNDAIMALEKAQAHDLEFQKQTLRWQQSQTEITRNQQDQIWTTFDILEMMRLTQPRMFFFDAYVDGAWKTYDTPYFKIDFTQDNDGPYITYKGVFKGFALVRVSMTNGALDEFGNNIANASGRLFKNARGAGHISCRSAVVQLYVYSLSRAVRVVQNRQREWEIQPGTLTGYTWDAAVTETSLTRHMGKSPAGEPFIRLRTHAFCNSIVTGEDGKTYNAYEMIPPQRIPLKPTYGALHFYEYSEAQSENRLYGPSTPIKE